MQSCNPFALALKVPRYEVSLVHFDPRDLSSNPGKNGDREILDSGFGCSTVVRYLALQSKCRGFESRCDGILASLLCSFRSQ